LSVGRGADKKKNDVAAWGSGCFILFLMRGDQVRGKDAVREGGDCLLGLACRAGGRSRGELRRGRGSRELHGGWLK